MAQAKILVNGVVGSNDDLPINVLVQLNNQNVGGESTYNWLILDQPPGPADVLSSLVLQNPTFTPRKEGTYLLQLTVNVGLPTEVTDSVICAIRQIKTRQRVPAAGETTQDGTAEGWAGSATNPYLLAVDKLLADPGIIVGLDTAGGLVAGDIVNASSSPTIKTGLPGQEVVPGFTAASASSSTTFNGMVAIVVSDVNGNTGPFAASTVIRVRYIGRYPAAPLAGASVGQIVYLSNSGVMSLTQGTNRRQVGTVMAVVGSTADVWFDGVGGFELTPVGAPYLINGPAATLTGAFDITNLAATLAFKQGTGHGAIDTVAIAQLAGATGRALKVLLNSVIQTSFGANGDLNFEAANTQGITWPDWGFFGTGTGSTATLLLSNDAHGAQGFKFHDQGVLDLLGASHTTTFSPGTIADTISLVLTTPIFTGPSFQATLPGAGGFFTTTKGLAVTRVGVSGATPIADVDNATIVGVATHSGGSTLTLSAITTIPVGAAIIVKDETGDAGTNNITVSITFGTIDGASSKVINSNSGVLRLYKGASGGTDLWYTC